MSIPKKAACALLLVLAWALVLPGAVPGQTPPERVDLRSAQSPLKDQGGRTTCSRFAVIAALEAAYRRAGHEVLLSEEFLGYMDNLLRLQKSGARQEAKVAELTLPLRDLGHPLALLEFLRKGGGVPELRHMPYRPKAYAAVEPSKSKLQYWADGFFLDPRHLRSEATSASRYFSVKTFATLKDPTSSSEFEQVLAKGREIIWSFRSAGDQTGAVWKYTAKPTSQQGGHAMLLVGYDRAKRVVLAKNSWGPTSASGSQGYTLLDYDYLKYGLSAQYIDAVNPPRAWPEVAFLGRWFLTCDGRSGILDIYHLANLFGDLHAETSAVKKEAREPDRRLGTFYDRADPNRAFRVNGTIRGGQIVFHIDWKDPNLKPAPLQGQKFTFTMTEGNRFVMVGWHKRPTGSLTAGFAQKLTSPRAFASHGRPALPPTLSALVAPAR